MMRCLGWSLNSHNCYIDVPSIFLCTSISIQIQNAVKKNVCSKFTEMGPVDKEAIELVSNSLQNQAIKIS